MFTEQVDIHIARTKRSNRGVKRHENRSGHPKVRGPEKTGPFGAVHPARSRSISACLRSTRMHMSSWGESFEQHELLLLGGRPAIKTGRHHTVVM